MIKRIVFSLLLIALPTTQATAKCLQKDTYPSYLPYELREVSCTQMIEMTYRNCAAMKTTAFMYTRGRIDAERVCGKKDYVKAFKIFDKMEFYDTMAVLKRELQSRAKTGNLWSSRTLQKLKKAGF